MSQVCRTCLEVIQNASELFSLEINEPALDTVHITTKLETCVPEMALHRVKNSVICIYCVGALNTAYHFKTKCLQTESRLFEYLANETTDCVDLNKFIEDTTKRPAKTMADQPDQALPLLITSVYTENETDFPVIPYTIDTTSLCPFCQESFASDDLLKEHMNSHAEDNLKCNFCDFHTNSKEYFQEHVETHNDVDPLGQCPLPMPVAIPNLETSYSCPSCDFTTINKSSLMEHRILHTGERLYYCNLCNFKSTHYSSHRRHLKVHKGDRPFRCTECRYGASDIDALKMHMRVHTGARPYQCTVCPYASVKKIHLKNHMARVHSDKLSNTFNPAESAFNGHLNTANGSEEARDLKSASNDPYQVSILDIHNILKEGDECSLSNESSSLMEVNDAETEDTDDVDYMVTVADLQEILQHKTPKSPGVENGIQSVHTNTVPQGNAENNEANGQNIIFRCPLCQEPFKFKYLLKKHISIHVRDNKPFECTECGYTTMASGQFKVHMNTHTGGKIYSCDKCDYSTVYWSNLNKHSRVHTGEKPYKCRYCNYRATQQTSVNSHMNIHPEYRPFGCKECPYAAETEVALQKHMEMHALGNHFMEDAVALSAEQEAA